MQISGYSSAAMLAYRSSGMKQKAGTVKMQDFSQMVQNMLEVYRDATGDNAPPKCIGGGTYAKMLPNVVAFGPLFAGDPVTEHQPDECIDLERLVQNAQIIANAIVKLANLPLE